MISYDCFIIRKICTSNRQDTVNLIITDIGRTFSDMNLFKPGQSLHDSLVKVLCAYVMHRPDLGYVSTVPIPVYHPYHPTGLAHTKFDFSPSSDCSVFGQSILVEITLT